MQREKKPHRVSVAISEGSQETELKLFNLSLLWGLGKMEPLPFHVHFTAIIHLTYCV